MRDYLTGSIRPARGFKVDLKAASVLFGAAYLRPPLLEALLGPVESCFVSSGIVLIWRPFRPRVLPKPPRELLGR